MHTPPPGTLSLRPGRPNPHGAVGARLFLLHGDAITAPIEAIIPAEPHLLPPRRSNLAQQPFHLKILHLNDLHGRICQLTPQGVQPHFSRIVSYIRQCRIRTGPDPNAATLVLSAGDDQGGSLFDELLGRTPNGFTAHPGYRLYSAAGFDAATFGNHDFDLDAPLLAHAIQQDAHFPLLSANLGHSRWLTGKYNPAALFVIKGVRVGVIGLTPPTRIRSFLDPELWPEEPLKVVHNLLPALRPLCDVLIILSHLGHSLAGNTDPFRHAGDIELAHSLPNAGATLIVGGHTHTVLNEHGLEAGNIINGVPILQAGVAGRFIGVSDIEVGSRPRVTAARLQPTAKLEVDESFEQQHVLPLVRQLLPCLTQKLGTVADHPDLTTAAIKNSFSAGESALANFITDGLVNRCRGHGCTVDFSMVDASNVNAGLPAGNCFTFLDWFMVMPYLDTVRLFRISGQQLLVLLQDNALRAHRPGEVHIRRGFLHFSSQVRYTIELRDSRAGATVTNITVNGRPLVEQLTAQFIVAGSRFVRGLACSWQTEMAGGDLSLVDIGCWPCDSTNFYIRDELLAYIRDKGGVTPQAGARRDGRLKVI
jgi:5'-nucleotidase/UDP-sugar diphosphatase